MHKFLTLLVFCGSALQVSNYAQPGQRSRHNQVYWRGEQYYAFGLGAASYLAGRRYSRPAKMKEYYAWVEQYAAAGGGKAAAACTGPSMATG
jgi:coproporphyrinogen III oxidase-like Fe-S oxidoreductase